MNVVYPITLDVKKHNIQKRVRAFTGEGGTRQLIITLVSGNETIELANNYTVSIVGVKPDGTEFANTATVEGGKIIYTLTTQNVAVEGDVVCQVRVLKSDELLYTSKFLIDVEDNLSDETAETSTNEWTELITALQAVQALGKKYQGEGAPTTDPEDYYGIDVSDFYYDTTNSIYYYATAVSTTITWELLYSKTTIDFLLSLKASVDSVYTKSQINTILEDYQHELTMGSGLTKYNDTISVALADTNNILKFDSAKLTLNGNDIANDNNFKTAMPYVPIIRYGLTQEIGNNDALASKSYLETVLEDYQAKIDSSHKVSADYISAGSNYQVVPKSTSSDSGKYLKVNSSGTPVWGTGGGGGGGTTYTAGDGIDISGDDEISVKLSSSQYNLITLDNGSLKTEAHAVGYNETVRASLMNDGFNFPLQAKLSEYESQTATIDYNVIGTITAYVTNYDYLQITTTYSNTLKIKFDNGEYEYANNNKIYDVSLVDTVTFYAPPASVEETTRVIEYLVCADDNPIVKAEDIKGYKEKDVTVFYGSSVPTNLYATGDYLDVKLGDIYVKTGATPEVYIVNSVYRESGNNNKRFSAEKNFKPIIGEGNPPSTASGEVLKEGTIYIDNSQEVYLYNAIYFLTEVTTSQQTTTYHWDRLPSLYELDLKQNQIVASTGLTLANDNKTLSVTTPLPTSAQADSGKLLSVNSSGNAEWQTKNYEDKTTIATDTSSTTPSLTLSDNHEYRYTTDLTSLTLTMPSGDFIASVVFSSGSTPTSMTYDSSIKWSGDDVTSNAFVPQANTEYEIVFWYNGLSINAVVRGVA